ncbi:hypothetical protein [Duganella sp.]|uniref:hypothetical protein n=1 Tax=Duganella sp. TaxID=1904440 RepID=UPI0031DB5F9A
MKRLLCMLAASAAMAAHAAAAPTDEAGFTEFGAAALRAELGTDVPLKVKGPLSRPGCGAGGTLLIAVPSPDVILYISESSASAIDALAALAKSTAAKSQTPLSPAVFKWSAQGWVKQ